MENILWDILFPENACSLCREKGKFNSRHPWCDHCQEDIERAVNSLPICDWCGKYLEQGDQYCSDCRVERPLFKIARAVGPYEDERFRKAVKVFKFLCRKYMGVKMGRMMAEVVKREPRYWPIDLLVPVPASPGSLKQRGFNQAEVLARQIGKGLRVAMNPGILCRIKETPSQRELTKLEREQNLLCAFKVTDPAKIKGKNILLVDDVYTTGSTIKECTRTLLESGAESVSVITWAIGKGF